MDQGLNIVIVADVHHRSLSDLDGALSVDAVIPGRGRNTIREHPRGMNVIALRVSRDRGATACRQVVSNSWTVAHNRGQRSIAAADYVESVLDRSAR